MKSLQHSSTAQHTPAFLKGSNLQGKTVMPRREAIDFLVSVVKTNPSHEAWTEARDYVEERMALSGADAVWIPNEVASTARQKAKHQMSARHIAANAVARQPLASPKHQAAVHCVLDLALHSRGGVDGQMATPFAEIPKVLRAAVNDAAGRSQHPFAGEVVLIKRALGLIEKNGGDAQVRTSETKALYSFFIGRDADFNLRVRRDRAN
jgi:hypothetical protein